MVITAIIGKTGCGKTEFVKEKIKDKNIIFIYDSIPHLVKYSIDGVENAYVVEEINDLSKGQIKTIINGCRKKGIDLYLLTTNPKVKWKVDEKIYLNYRNLDLSEKIRRLCEKTDGDVRKAIQILKYGSDYMQSIESNIVKILQNFNGDINKTYNSLLPYFDMKTQQFIIALYQKQSGRFRKLLASLMILNDDYINKSKFKQYLLYLFLLKLPKNATPSYSFRFGKNFDEGSIEWLCKKYSISKRIAIKYLPLCTLKIDKNIEVKERKERKDGKREEKKIKNLFSF